MSDPRRRLAWLPFRSRDEADRALGGLPDGIEVESFVDPIEPWPDSIAEVGFLVVPYLTGDKGLTRIAEMTALEVVQLNMAGFDGIPEQIPDRVALCNASGVHDTSTAELAIGLALAQGRGLDRYARNMPAGIWDRGPLGRSLADQRMMILGYGSIGKAIERRLEPMEPASITKVASRARGDIRGIDELDELLPTIDVLFVICPLNDTTRGLLDARRLALLPDQALIVNVARGPIIDTDALLTETSTGRLRAALDVTDPEPLPVDHPLWRSPGVLISPHTGGPSTAFGPRANALVGRQLRHWAAGEELENRVL